MLESVELQQYRSTQRQLSQRTEFLLAPIKNPRQNLHVEKLLIVSTNSLRFDVQLKGYFKMLMLWTRWCASCQEPTFSGAMLIPPKSQRALERKAGFGVGSGGNKGDISKRDGAVKYLRVDFLF